jgi:ABC-type polysaccharide/polyol phosphate export permease
MASTAAVGASLVQNAAHAVKDYFGRIWACRYFWLSLVRMDLRLRYRRSALGIAWSLLNPLLMTAVLCFAFGTLFQQKVSEFAPYLLVGLAFWSFVTHTVTQGCHSLQMGEQYIRQHPAPIAIYPLRTTLGNLFHFLMALSVALLLTWFFRGFGNLTALPALLGAVGLIVVAGWAIATLVAFANVYVPDTSHLSEVGLQFLFYLTPVIYPPGIRFGRGGFSLETVLACNPLSWFLKMLREPILEGRVPGAETVAGATIATALLLTAAIATLARCEKKVIFQL